MAITFWFLKDLLWAVLGLVSANKGGGVAFGAHVGGFLGGLAMIAVYKWIAKPRENSGDAANVIIDPALIFASVAHRDVATSETPTIYLHDGAEQTGPFTLTHVQSRLARGEIGRDALYWSEGMDDWQSVLDLAAHPLQ